ncbi:hypothetical protein H6G97_31675 [Nostoc flagelliforme FACHB-838]|uniref:Uncharacterized protein n=1 Tax=Nostoc flagelliforme FACHB-838 TaxID=2692904 RepID=A0ABR8DZS3_9NOSO|nr:hypothetical protein [Nostoc flagelliforme]MBD2533863.1 hypothetical protein [Nostoc flagelliforme FACHB-838]
MKIEQTNLIQGFPSFLLYETWDLHRKTMALRNQGIKTELLRSLLQVSRDEQLKYSA